MIHSIKRFLIHLLLTLYVCIAAWGGSIINASALEATVDADPPVEAMISRLSGLGFSCLTATQDPNSARRCVGRIPGYSKKVAIYLPVHYEPAPHHQPVITHFQGWTVHERFEGTLQFYQLGQELHHSGTNKVLVVPESVGHCETYLNELNTTEQFNAFSLSLQRILRSAGVLNNDDSSMTQEVTGHSGAFVSIGNIIKNPNSISKVLLFDALYCSPSSFSPLTSANTPSGACQGIRKFATEHPDQISAYFLASNPNMIKGAKLLFSHPRTLLIPVQIGDHFSIMNGRYREAIRD